MSKYKVDNQCDNNHYTGFSQSQSLSRYIYPMIAARVLSTGKWGDLIGGEG